MTEILEKLQRNFQRAVSESADSAAHNKLGQLAWESADVPSGSLTGSRRLASPLPVLGSSSQDYPACLGTLLSSVLCLQPVCCITLRQWRDSFKLCNALPQHSSCHALLYRCGLFHHLNSCHGSFHAASWIFGFWMIRKWWVVPARPCLSSWWGFIPSERLGSVTFPNVHGGRSWIIITAGMIKWADVAV